MLLLLREFLYLFLVYFCFISYFSSIVLPEDWCKSDFEHVSFIKMVLIHSNEAHIHSRRYILGLCTATQQQQQHQKTTEKERWICINFKTFSFIAVLFTLSFRREIGIFWTYSWMWIWERQNNVLEKSLRECVCVCVKWQSTCRRILCFVSLSLLGISRWEQKNAFYRRNYIYTERKRAVWHVKDLWPENVFKVFLDCYLYLDIFFPQGGHMRWREVCDFFCLPWNFLVSNIKQRHSDCAWVCIDASQTKQIRIFCSHFFFLIFIFVQSHAFFCYLSIGFNQSNIFWLPI